MKYKTPNTEQCEQLVKLTGDKLSEHLETLACTMVDKGIDPASALAIVMKATINCQIRMLIETSELTGCRLEESEAIETIQPIGQVVIKKITAMLKRAASRN